jgi:hypothetical protein
MPRHKSVRCYGFRSTDRQYLHCTRSEYANGLAPHKGGDTYVHRAEGEKNAKDVCRNGGVATCNIGGAGKRLEPYAKYFKAKTSSRFVVVADVGDAA